MLLKAKDVKPNDPAVYMTLAGYYNRQGQFDKTIEALEQRAAKEPNNPEAYLHDRHATTGTNAQRDFTSDGRTRRRTYVQKGLDGRRQGARAQARLRRSARLQRAPPPPRRRTSRRIPTKQQALIKEAVTLQRQGEGPPQEEDGGRRA